MRYFFAHDFLATLYSGSREAKCLGGKVITLSNLSPVQPWHFESVRSAQYAVSDRYLMVVLHLDLCATLTDLH